MAFPILPAAASYPGNEGPALPRVTDDVNDLIIASGETYDLYGPHTYLRSVQINGTLNVKAYDGINDVTGTLKLIAPFIIVGPTGKIVADGKGFGGGGGATCYASATPGGKGGTQGRGGDGGNSGSGFTSASGGGGSPNGAPGASGYGIGGQGMPAQGGSGGVYSTYQSGSGGIGYGGGGGGGVSGAAQGGGGGGGGGSGGKDAITLGVGGNGGGQYSGAGGKTTSTGYNSIEDAFDGGYMLVGGNGDSTTDATVLKGSGGGGGGAASTNTGGGGGGGAGGGAIMLLSSSDIIMAGSITSNGGGGGTGGYYLTSSPAGRGGGGAGGGVLISGLNVMLTGSVETQGRNGNIQTLNNGGTVKLMYETDQFSGSMTNIKAGRIYKNGRPVMQGLISPEPNQTTELEPVFKWEPAVDPESDSISYELQVATNTKFSPVELDVEDLDSTEYSAVKELIGGNFYWRVRAKDKVGYGSWSAPSRFVTDILPPTSRVLPLDQYVNSTSFKVSWTGGDDSSGISRYTVYVAEGNLTSRIWIQSTTNRSSIYEGREGVKFSFSCIALDRAGNREAVHPKMDTCTTVDITPPTSEIASITSGSSPLSMLVSWTGRDALSGIKAFNVYVSDDGGDFVLWQKETTLNDEEFEGEEKHEYTFITQAIDRAWNIEPLDYNRSMSGKLDSVAPVTSLTIEGTSFGTDPTYISPVTPMIFNGADDFAGYNSTNYAIDDRDIALYNGTMLLEQMPGLHNMTFWGRDRSGNEEAPQSFLFFVDADAPVTFFSFEGPNFITETKTYISNLTSIKLEATDLSSGINYTEYRLDNYGWRRYTEPLRFEVSGVHTLVYRSVDLVGNPEAEKSVRLSVDVEPPVTKAVPTAMTSSLDIYVVISATDYESGVTATFYRVSRQGRRNLGDFQVGNEVYIEASDDHTLDSNYTIQYYSVDNVNNVEAVGELVVNIDTDIFLRMGFSGTLKVENPRYLVEGKTEPGSTLTINKQPVIVTPDGTFATQVGLQSGSNKVLVTIMDPAGNLFTKTYYINYNAPVGVASWVIPLLVLLVAAILVAAGAYLIIRPTAPIPRPSPYQ